MSRTDLPNERAPNFPARTRETLQTLLGLRGDKLDRALTLRDVIENKLFTLRTGVPIGSGTLPLVPGDGGGSGWPGTDPYEPDLTPPPSPGALTATPAISHVLIEVPPATYLQGHGHLRTHVYGANPTPARPNPTFADAVEVGQFEGTIWAMPSNPATTWHLWAKWESKDNVLSVDPTGGTNGVIATTAQDVSLLLDALSGSIGESELATGLTQRINLIDGTGPGSVTARLLAEAQARGAAILVETQARQTAIASEAAARQTLTTAMQTADSQLASAIQTETTARTTAIAAEATARQALAARVTTAEGDINTAEAAIVNEATARADADTALGQQISTVSAVANAKNRTYRQTTAPTGTLVAGDVWYDSDDNNKPYRYSGTAWVATDDTRIAANAAAIITEATARADADSANALATQQVQARLDTGDYAAVKVQSSATASKVDGLEAQYTVKLDVAGLISGYGLASTAVNAAPTSSFGVRAGNFFVAPPAVASATAPTTNLFKGFVWLDTSVTPNVTRYYTGTAWSTTPQTLPFIVQTVPTTINGVAVPPGMYAESAFIQNGTITNAKIANLAVDDAKIASLSAAKINAGFIDAARIAVGSLDAKIANLDAAVIQSGFINQARINALDAGKINTGFLSAARIAVGSLDGTVLTARSIKTDRLEVGSVSAPFAAYYTDAGTGLIATDTSIGRILPLTSAWVWSGGRLILCLKHTLKIAMGNTDIKFALFQVDLRVNSFFYYSVTKYAEPDYIDSFARRWEYRLSHIEIDANNSKGMFNAIGQANTLALHVTVTPQSAGYGAQAFGSGSSFTFEGGVEMVEVRV